MNPIPYLKRELHNLKQGSQAEIADLKHRLAAAESKRDACSKAIDIHIEIESGLRTERDTALAENKLLWEQLADRDAAYQQQTAQLATLKAELEERTKERDEAQMLCKSTHGQVSYMLLWAGAQLHRINKNAKKARVKLVADGHRCNATAFVDSICDLSEYSDSRTLQTGEMYRERLTTELVKAQADHTALRTLADGLAKALGAMLDYDHPSSSEAPVLCGIWKAGCEALAAYRAQP